MSISNYNVSIFLQAICCPGGKYCCPFGSKCLTTSASCQRGNEVFPWLQKTQAKVFLSFVSLEWTNVQEVKCVKKDIMWWTHPLYGIKLL